MLGLASELDVIRDNLKNSNYIKSGAFTELALDKKVLKSFRYLIVLLL
jgi:hypothetical protein